MDADRLLAGLDAQQRRAVVDPHHPLGILAGAGSGKTRVLTRRIAHRSATHSADPRYVLAITFTRKAATELTTRLGALGLRDRPTTGTFHAVAWAQLHSWWRDTGRRAPSLLERKGPLIGRLTGKGRLSPADVAAEIEWARARGVTPAGYSLAARQEDRRIPAPWERVAELYAAYEEEKAKRGVVDFDDLLVLAAEALETDAAFARAQRWRFRHLFVDEFQDVNALQHRLLRAWLGDRDDLCVVGDPNQAIYRWNGADADYLLRFGEHHRGARVLELRTNYRSTPEILAVGAAVLAGGSVHSQPPRSPRPHGAIPRVVSYPTETDEALGIARELRTNRRPGGRWADQAVLVRTNGQTGVIEQALRQARIPYRVRGARPFLGRPEVRDALRSVTHPPDRPAAAALDDLEALAAATDQAVGEREEDRREALATLVRLAREFRVMEPDARARDFTNWLVTAIGGDDPARGVDAVDLVTLHAAKGLEWSIVHLAGVEAGFMPIHRARTPEARAEERRLAYVAVTRAEDELRVTWAEERSFNDRVARRRPSPYLSAIADTAAGLRAAPSQVDHDRGLARARAVMDIPTIAGEGSTVTGERELLDALRAWRDRAARSAVVPPALVAGDAALAEVAARRPADHDALAAIAGIGPVRAAEYGGSLLALVAEHPPVGAAHPSHGG